MPIPSYIPENLKQFWSENPTKYTKDDIFHLEPDSETAVFLKDITLNSAIIPNPPNNGIFTLKSVDGVLKWDSE